MSCTPASIAKSLSNMTFLVELDSVGNTFIQVLETAACAVLIV
jgi:hypothetical protein